ncbi:MAG: hypothetical protein AAFQ57_12490 [Cyanobacteria bacterium J06626_14]
MTNKRQQALEVTADDLNRAYAYFRDNFSDREREDWHYETMFSLVNPALDALPKNRVPDDLTTFRIHWMFAVSAWNKRSYQRNSRDPLDHFRLIEQPLRVHWVDLMAYRQRNILSLSDEDQETIKRIFSDFLFLGSVGVAKGLHLIAPYFFSPWDTQIYQGYGYKNKNPVHYWLFLRQTQAQIERLNGNFTDENPIKAIDRFNFWHFTRNRGKK